MHDSHETSDLKSPQRRPLWPWIVAAIVLTLMSLIISFWLPMFRANRVLDIVAGPDGGHPRANYHHPSWLFFIDERRYHPWFDEVEQIWYSTEPATDELLRDLELFPELLNLDLDLSEASPQAIEGLVQFQELVNVEFSGNGQPIPLAWLGQLPKLQEVWLYDIPYASEDWKAIAASSTSIGRVMLRGANEPLTAEDAEALASLPGLWEINLTRGTTATAEFWEPFARRGKLEVLLIDDPTLDDEKMKQISEITSLRWLRIWDHAEFTTAEIEPLNRLKRLEELELAGTELPLEAYRILAALPSLKHLDLHETSVDDQALNLLSKSTSLETLNIEGSNATDEGLMSLEKLSTLKIVNIRDTPVTSAGIREFQTARPRTVVDNGY